MDMITNTKKLVNFVFWSIIVMLLLVVQPASAELAITIEDLGTLGGTNSYPIAINEQGQVIGYSKTASGEQHAFIWDSTNGMQDLETLGGTYSTPVAINEQGQVIGHSWTASGEQHAFIWTSTDGIKDLGTLGSSSHPTAINDQGQVIGENWAAHGSHAFIWDSINGMQDLGTLGGSYSFPKGFNEQGQEISDNFINEQGQVIGYSKTASGEQHAFIWDSINGMQDLGTLGGSYSYPTAINEQGQVIGKSWTAFDVKHAFIWTSTDGMQDLGTFGGVRSYPTAINEHGQIIGSTYILSGLTYEHHALMWTIELSPITPEEKIEAIIDDIRSLVQDSTLNEGQGISLTTKLETVERKLNEGNINVACNLLNKAFVNYVQALINAGILSETLGQQLIDAANNAVECE